jgi:hypothetical protein
MESKDHLERLQEQINQLIGTESTLKRRKRTKEDAQKELFLTIIPLIEHVLERNIVLDNDYGVNNVKYDEPFFKIIDSLIYLHFDTDAADLIMFYIYDRVNPDGSLNALIDSEGTEVFLETPIELWHLVKQVLDETNKKK